MDWNLVCQDRGWRAFAQSVFMFGVMIGSYLFGDLSDRFGRKVTFLSSVLIQAIFGIAAGLAPDYWSFILLRYLS